MPDTQVIEVSIAAKHKSDVNRLLAALNTLAAEDPFFGVSTDVESGQIVLKGVSELQLDAHITTLKRTYQIDVDVGAPQVAYRETLTRRVEKDYSFKKRVGISGQFARVKMIFEPDAIGGFESHIDGGAVPDDFLPGVSAGIESAMQSGILAGFPVTGVKATLIDGAFHATDSSADAFEIAARAACREALREGGSILLEPVMAVEVTAPDTYLGFVIGDLRVRRGNVLGHATRGETVIDALVPLANMFGYDSQLRSGTQGHGVYTMRFSHYAPTPPRPDDDGPSAPAVALRG